MLPSWYRDIERRVTNMISRGIISKITEGETQTADLSVMTGEDFTKVERVQNYGFSSFPGPQAQATVVYVTGSREFPIIIAADHPALRFKVKEWESAMYTKFETYWHLRADKSLHGKADRFELILAKDALIKAEKFTLELSGDALVKAKKASIEATTFAFKTPSDELIKLLSELIEAIAGIAGQATGPSAPVNFAPFIAKITPLVPRIKKFMG